MSMKKLDNIAITIIGTDGMTHALGYNEKFYPTMEDFEKSLRVDFGENNAKQYENVKTYSVLLTFDDTENMAFYFDGADTKSTDIPDLVMTTAKRQLED